MAWSTGPGYRGTREGCERVQDREARCAGASGRARGRLGLPVGDGSDKRDPTINDTREERWIGPVGHATVAGAGTQARAGHKAVKGCGDGKWLGHERSALERWWVCTPRWLRISSLDIALQHVRAECSRAGQ
jgi:hypothetical protein